MFVFVFVCANLYLYSCICICICVLVFVFDHDDLLFWFIFDENPFLRLRLALHEYLESAQGGEPNSRTERPKVVPRVPNRRFLMCDPNKFAFEGIADQKIALSVLVIFWPPDPIQCVCYTRKLAPQALLCSQGMLETP